MSHVAHMNEACHTYEWVMSHIRMFTSQIWMKFATQMNTSCHTHEWVMQHRCMVTSHVWIHVTHVNASCHTNVPTYNRQLAATSMPTLNPYKQSHVTRLNTSRMNWATCEFSQVTRMFESCHMQVSTSKKAALIWINHVTPMNCHVTQMNSCHRYERIMSHTWRHVTHMYPPAKRQQVATQMAELNTDAHSLWLNTNRQSCWLNTSIQSRWLNIYTQSHTLSPEAVTRKVTELNTSHVNWVTYVSSHVTHINWVTYELSDLTHV